MYSSQDGDFCLIVTVKAGCRGPLSPVSSEYRWTAVSAVSVIRIWPWSEKKNWKIREINSL